MKKTTFLFVALISIQFYAQQTNSIPTDSIQETDSLVINNESTNSFTIAPKPVITNNTKDNLDNMSNSSKSVSPYEWIWLRDGIWTGVGLGASAVGLSLIKNKDDLPVDEIPGFTDPESLQKKIDNINFLDRWVAGNHSETANNLSDIPFAASFIAPFAILFDDEVNDHTGQFLGMYLESLATTAGMYTITAGLVDRSRPYVYDNSGDTSDGRRFRNNGQRAFYSGHVAATATATFFAVKVFSDFNPDANGKVFMWAGAAALPAAVGVLRMEAGQHFFTDVLLGYVLGAGTGILVPELHKRKNDNIQVYPSSGTSFNGDIYKGMALSYTFK